MSVSDKHPAGEEPRFLADVMLGSLAKWLRILGYDTVYDNRIADDHLIGRCRAEQRTALTRDVKLAQRLKSGILFINSEDLSDQLVEVLGFLVRKSIPLEYCTAAWSAMPASIGFPDKWLKPGSPLMYFAIMNDSSAVPFVTAPIGQELIATR